MVGQLRPRHRILFGAAGLVAACLGAGLVAAGFAFSAVLPGLSWGLGSALGLIVFFGAGRWLHAALTGRSPNRQERAAGKGGAL